MGGSSFTGERTALIMKLTHTEKKRQKKSVDTCVACSVCVVKGRQIMTQTNEEAAWLALFVYFHGVSMRPGVC